MVVHLLTPTLGNRSYIVTVGNSPSSVHRSLLQPLWLLEFEGESAVGEGLHKMREVRLSPPLRTIAVEPVKAMVVMMICELLYRIVKDSDVELYQFVESAILRLDDVDSKSQSTAIANFHLHFLVHLSSHLGYAPTNNYSVGHFFDIKEGEFTLLKPLHNLYFEPEQARLLFDIYSVAPTALCELQLNRDIRRSFLNSMVDYFGYHTDAIHKVRSIELFSEVF